MHMHSELRVSINRNLGFRIPIADAQPFGIRTLSPAPRILPILPPRVDLKLLGFSESKCRWTRGLPNRVAGLSMCRCTRGPPQTIHRPFRCANALADRQTVLQDFRCADAPADPHKPSIGFFDAPMHSRLQTVPWRRVRPRHPVS